MTAGCGKSSPPRPAPNKADQLPARCQPRTTRDFLSPAPSAVNPGPGQDSPGFSAWRMIRIVRADMAIYPPFGTAFRDPRGSQSPLDHHRLDMGDRLGGVQALRAGLGAVHDRVAAVEAERVLEIVEPLALRFVARIDEPAVRLQQDRRAKVAVAVPPKARACGRARSA